jgi:putative FmdB family regulatory protein|tara:strand:+ start:287 stop:487 length:201 start_codon:yes stop_codon:yes gene_type:complete
MPFFTFKCPKCEDEIEVLQSTSKPPSCKECSTLLPRRFIEMERVFKVNIKPASKGGKWCFGKDKKG